LTVSVPEAPRNPPVSAPNPRLTEVLSVIGVTCALLIPCVWQERIQAGDLGIHIYNAWLVPQIRSGSIAGLAVENRWNNILGDWILAALLPVVGPVWTERLVACAVVLLFFWAAFYFLKVVLNQSPWSLIPFLAMFAYGFMFRNGLLNCYLSTGLCLIIVALLWRPTVFNCLVAIPVGVLAVLAHLLPVAWAASVLAYIFAFRRVQLNLRVWLPCAEVLSVLGVSAILMSHFPHRWSLSELVNVVGISSVTGVEQVLTFSAKYLLVAGSLLAIWSVLFLRRFDHGRLSGDLLFQLWALHALASAALPLTIQFPNQGNVFSLIPERLSIFIAVLFCAFVGGLQIGRLLMGMSVLLCGIYFTFFYADTRAYNQVERQVNTLLDNVPAGARVICEVDDSNSPMKMQHPAFMSCIGRCFNYADYEPATGQFRIRALQPNSVAASTMDTLKEFAMGTHVVTQAEAPIYAVCASEDPRQRFVLRRLEAGETTCTASLPTAPEWRQLIRLNP
jgi:hypothetical protein